MKTGRVLLAASLAVSMLAAAAAAKVDVTKDRDSHIKVWNTIFGFRIGDPIYDGDLPAGHRLVVTEGWWATDTSMQQTFIAAPAVVASLAPIVDDPANPGQFTMRQLEPWLLASVAPDRLALPDLASDVADIYIAVDLDDYLGTPPPAPGEVLMVNGGTIPGLAGYSVGLSPQSFDPVAGWVNHDPYDGPVTVIGEIGLTAPDVTGENCFEVECGRSSIQFGGPELPPIPADFFDPGSEPFFGEVQFKGGDPGGPDTRIRRLADPFERTAPPSPQPVTVPIEIVQLRLVSCSPITVVTNEQPELWDVRITLSDVPGPLGAMTVTKTHDSGGTFSAELPVQPRFTFTKVDDPQEVRVLDTGLAGMPPLNLAGGPGDWDHDYSTPKENPACDAGIFVVRGPAPLRLQSEQGSAVLDLVPPGPVSAFFALDSENQWRDAMDLRIIPFSHTAAFPLSWQGYMEQWRMHLQQGEPYPENEFLEPELYVYPGTLCDDRWPSSPGLVMAAGDPSLPDGSYSSAWRYRYPDDPDLSGATITITVLPPCGVNVVSFGMQDINGNIRAWYWNVGPLAGSGTLQCGVPTAININGAVAGVAAAAPAAASFTNNPAFDVTKVQDFIVDENWNWVGGPQAVPPPGQTLPRMWNYWYDLIVTPNQQVKTGDPRKWSQPPVECGPQIFLGWDELSVREQPPLMADDWLCTDKRPVTDIHWWGSFLNWDAPELPPQVPVAFHFGIWTDVPRDPNRFDSFSHPKEMVWEYTCTDFTWNFAGFDKDPRRPLSETTVDPSIADAVFQPIVRDACFQFFCRLPEAEWFYQDPGPCGKNVYWLSIAAVYAPDQPDPQYPWGWKTRPKYFNDDAIRVRSLADGTWPPRLGARYQAGDPVEFPRWVSWDLAFELTTDRECPPAPLEADFDLDGLVSWPDFAFFGSQWLATWP